MSLNGSNSGWPNMIQTYVGTIRSEDWDTPIDGEHKWK